MPKFIPRIHPNILIDESKITYYYELNDSASADIILGYSCGTIYFDDNHFPNRLVGFAVDSYSSEKQPYVSKKIDLKNTREAKRTGSIRTFLWKYIN